MSTTNILEPKDPSDLKDYGIEWSAVLAAESETGIATSTWSVSDPLGLTVVSAPPHLPYISLSGTMTVVWVSGGVAGNKYALTNTIVTSSLTPRTHQRTIYISCAER